jgi:DNA-binding NarL/FixJ family response regulator
MKTSPASVLIIESHPMLRAALCAAIMAEPDLTVAEQDNDSADAAQVIISIQPDAILLHSKPDLILLSMGNYELNDLEALMIVHKSLPDTPILALASEEVLGQEQAALECGAQAVLTKAAWRSEIIRALRKLRTQTAVYRS